MEEPPALEFQAGQWISVPLGPKTVRAYSIASTPRSRHVVTLCADVAPGGTGSRWFRGLGPGTPVEFKGPLGGFVFARGDRRRPLFVAEEIGIVPIRAILTELYETGFGRPTTLVHAARAAELLIYRDEFVSLTRRYPAFTYVAVIDPAMLVDRVARETASIDDMVAYVCGGESTIHAVRDLLTGRGLDRRAVKWEKFW